MVVLKWILIVLFLLVVGVVACGQVGLFQGRMPNDLGVHDGRLKPPSATDNSVTSQAALYPDRLQATAARIDPLALRGTGPETIARIEALVKANDAARVVKVSPDYVYAQYTSRWLKFVDDVEFWYDPGTHAIQVRSASRIGEGDLGVNRKRIEAIRAALAAAS